MFAQLMLKYFLFLLILLPINTFCSSVLDLVFDVSLYNLKSVCNRPTYLILNLIIVLSKYRSNSAIQHHHHHLLSLFVSTAGQKLPSLSTTVTAIHYKLFNISLKPEEKRGRCQISEIGITYTQMM